jgi:branched-chain amino acid transport system substrate-binding protein
MLKRLALALCAVSTTLLAAAPAEAQANKPFRVAAIVAKTGVLATVLGPAGIGFEAYVDQVNKAGGVNGRRIELERYDEQSTPAVAAGLFQRVLSDPPVAMIFFGQSTSMTQSRQLLVNAGMPVITVTADDSFLYPTPAKTIFMLNLSTVQQANSLLGVMKQQVGDLKGKKIAIAAVQTTFSDGIIRNLQAAAEKGGFTLAATEKFPAGIPSFASQAANIARANPDAVFVMAGNADAPLITRAISDAGVTKAPLIAYAAAATDEVYQKVNLPNFMAFRFTIPASELPDLVAKMAGTPFAADMNNNWWGTGWLAGNVLRAGLEKCPADCDGAKLIAAMETMGPVATNEKLTYGPPHFTADNHAGLATAQTFMWKNGKVTAEGQPFSTVAAP